MPAIAPEFWQDYYPRKSLEGLVGGGGAFKQTEALFYASEIVSLILLRT